VARFNLKTCGTTGQLIATWAGAGIVSPASKRWTAAEVLEPVVCVERAELARLAHDETTRQRELRETRRLFIEMGATIRAAEVAKELA
jgi:hypothetical protein